MLSKADILKAEDRNYRDVAVPEWGGTVRLAVMSGSARDQYEMNLTKVKPDGTREQDLSNIRAKLVSACLVDENFVPMFTAQELGKKNGKVLDRLFEIANELNATSEEEVEKAVKN